MDLLDEKSELIDKINQFDSTIDNKQNNEEILKELRFILNQLDKYEDTINEHN